MKTLHKLRAKHFPNTVRSLTPTDKVVCPDQLLFKAGVNYFYFKVKLRIIEGYDNWDVKHFLKGVEYCISCLDQKGFVSGKSIRWKIYKKHIRGSTINWGCRQFTYPELLVLRDDIKRIYKDYLDENK